MSPEAVSERKYSSKSDVWSYGVFAWEVFSLGAKPYPDMGAHAVITAVARGYRMPRPDLCPPDVYVAHVLSLSCAFDSFIFNAGTTSCCVAG